MSFDSIVTWNEAIAMIRTILLEMNLENFWSFDRHKFRIRKALIILSACLFVGMTSGCMRSVDLASASKTGAPTPATSTPKPAASAPQSTADEAESVEKMVKQAIPMMTGRPDSIFGDFSELRKSPNDKPKKDREFRSFPVEPPLTGVKYTLPAKFFNGSKNLGQVEEILSKKLDEAKYWERSFYDYPAGFVLVTKIERIHQDGTPFPEPQRWDSQLRVDPSADFWGFLRGSFWAPIGYYRVMVFIVTAHPVQMNETPPEAKDASNWVSGGADRLPLEMRKKALVDGTGCTVLIYEFLGRGIGPASEVSKIKPLGWSGHTHLVKAGFLK
jgi:hypothetical protein